MNIANCNGDFQCESWNELKDFIVKSARNPYDDIWLNGDNEYPCLAILINGTYACVHYFLNDYLLDEAIECARQFFETLNKPDCIEWREL